MNDDAPAAYGPWFTSKYTRTPRALAGTDCAAADTPASIARQTFCASLTPSNWPTVSNTRCTSAWVLGSSATTAMPKVRKRSATRDEVAISTTSGLSATMASTFGSNPPPIVGRRCTLAG